MTPQQRLEFSKSLVGEKRAAIIDSLTVMYEGFLKDTNLSKDALREKMLDSDYYKVSLEDARKFGDGMFELLQGISEDHKDDPSKRRFFRYITV